MVATRLPLPGQGVAVGLVLSGHAQGWPAVVLSRNVTTTATTLPPAAESVAAARRFVQEHLAALGAPAAGEDAAMLVSELATNVVLHARTPFTVEVRRSGETVRVCVLDQSPVRPRTRDYGTDATTGRGMRLVASLASDWGVEVQDGGKTVWFELPVVGSADSVTAWDAEDDVDLDALLASFGDDEPGAARAAGMRLSA